MATVAWKSGATVGTDKLSNYADECADALKSHLTTSDGQLANVTANLITGLAACTFKVDASPEPRKSYQGLFPLIHITPLGVKCHTEESRVLHVAVKLRLMIWCHHSDVDTAAQQVMRVAASIESVLQQSPYSSSATWGHYINAGYPVDVESTDLEIAPGELEDWYAGIILTTSAIHSEGID